MSILLRILTAGTGLMPSDLLTIIADAPRRYKTFEIPKRSGGMREIAQPARELKLIQRVLLDDVLAKLPLHGSASAYHKRSSIKKNAEMHAGSSPILKMDFKEFFPSLISRDWKTYCAINNVFDSFDTDLSSNILFRKSTDRQGLFLSIGAPSSPTLSNILMFEFDNVISVEARAVGVQYTRYADDLTFSSDRSRALEHMAMFVERTVINMQSPKLVINSDKTCFVTPASRRTVTGVVLSNQGQTGLGREKRRLLAARVHYAILGRLTSEEIIRLAGYLAFVKVIEPPFLDVLTQKYGKESLRKILSASQQSYKLRKDFLI